MSRMFGILENGELKLREPNEPVTVNGERLITNDPRTMLQAGYKLVILTAPPVSEGGAYTWREDEETITQIWEDEEV